MRELRGGVLRAPGCLLRSVDAMIRAGGRLRVGGRVVHREEYEGFREALTDAVADAGGHGATASTGGHEAMSATDGGADDHESHLALAGFVAGLLGLLAGGIALLRTRRPRERTAAPTTPGPGT